MENKVSPQVEKVPLGAAGVRPEDGSYAGQMTDGATPVGVTPSYARSGAGHSHLVANAKPVPIMAMPTTRFHCWRSFITQMLERSWEKT